MSNASAIEWPDLQFGPVNLWSVVAAWKQASQTAARPDAADQNENSLEPCPG